MRTQLVLTIVLLTLGRPGSSLSQLSPDLEFGSIITTALKKSQEKYTPLNVNHGNATFEARWDILLGLRVREDLYFYADLHTTEELLLEVYGLSVIYQPSLPGWLGFEVGKFLAPFGNFLPRRWASENPFIDYHITYDYLTVVSAFDLPENEEEILRVRGEGNSFEYRPQAGEVVGKALGKAAVGYLPESGSGLRILSRSLYLTGGQIFGRVDRLQYNLAITNGSLSNPADINNSNGFNLLARLTYNPIMGLVLGTSVSGLQRQEAAGADR
jgi:hypothetical protein